MRFGASNCLIQYLLDAYFSRHRLFRGPLRRFLKVGKSNRAQQTPNNV
jgi:hypothetical protein